MDTDNLPSSLKGANACPPGDTVLLGVTVIVALGEYRELGGERGGVND